MNCLLYDRDDLKQEAYLYTTTPKYHQKMEKYVPKRGCKEAFQRRIIRNYICDILSKEANRMKRFVHLVPECPTEESIIDKLEAKEMIDFLTKGIKDKELKEIWDICLETPVDFVETNNNSRVNAINIARYFHISVPEASRRIKALLENLYELLLKWEEINS